jgi:hypothetical protein
MPKPAARIHAGGSTDVFGATNTAAPKIHSRILDAAETLRQPRNCFRGSSQGRFISSTCSLMSSTICLALASAFSAAPAA